MIQIRRASDRGEANLGWLQSQHTFSFGQYYDPGHMGYGSLRVINEDRVAPSRGFDAHSHKDMEIVTYVLGGALEHRDSLGHGSVIRPGDVQRMTAGTGVTHSEYNASDEEIVHFLQIWIVPERAGLEPGYEQRHFDTESMRNRLCLIGSSTGRDGSITLHQDADLYATEISPDASLEHCLRSGRQGWLQVTRGRIAIDGEALLEGDGAAIGGTDAFRIDGDGAFLFFDLKEVR